MILATFDLNPVNTVSARDEADFNIRNTDFTDVN